MIVLLSCSTNLLANDEQHSSTGDEDSVLISYNDLRRVNGKLIELNYQKDINDALRECIRTDSSIIVSLSNSNNTCIKQYNHMKVQRNVGVGFGFAGILSILLSIIF